MDVIFPVNSHVFPDPPDDTTAVTAASWFGNNPVILPYKDYPEREEFQKIFTHSGPNPLEFERWCFEQWFVIRQWMKTNNKAIVFKAEFDVLIMVNLDHLIPAPCRDFLYTTPVATSFITRAGIDYACETIMNAFREEGLAMRLSAPEHVADCFLLRPPSDSVPGAFPDLSKEVMTNIELPTPAGVQMYQGHRDVFFQNGQAFYFLGDETRRLATLHCWGRAKWRLDHIYNLLVNSKDTPARLTY